MKALVIGHSSYDVSCQVDEYPVENTKYRLEGSVMCGGGPAGNAAYLLGKWGIDTYYAGVLGADDFGNKIKKEFESVGVHTEYIETNYEKPTSLSFIMINKNNGSRTLFNIAGERPGMKKYEFTMDPDIILIDGHEYNASMAALNKYPNAISVIDAGRITPELLELCKYTKYVVTSKGFAETVSKMKFDFANPNTLVQIYSVVKNRFPKSEIVITLEDKGALYAVNNEIKIMPGLKINAVDTTGAGDIFHGAFTYGLAKGFDLEKTIRYANITAGLSIQKVGARLSIPNLVDVNNFYNEKFGQAPIPNANPTPQMTNSNLNTNQVSTQQPALQQTFVQPQPVATNSFNAQNVAVNQTSQFPTVAPMQNKMSYEQALSQHTDINAGNQNV